jgi:hypothetical protein
MEERMDRIAEFKLQVLRAIAVLFDALERPTIGPDEVLGCCLQHNEREFEQLSSRSNETIYWLYKRGIVNGILEDRAAVSYLAHARLAEWVRAILTKELSKETGESLADLISETARYGGPDEMIAVSNLLFHRLSR